MAAPRAVAFFRDPRGLRRHEADAHLMNPAILEQVVSLLGGRIILDIELGRDEQALLVLDGTQSASDDVGRLAVLMVPMDRDAGSAVVVLLQGLRESAFGDHVTLQVLVAESAGVAAENAFASRIIQGFHVESELFEIHCPSPFTGLFCCAFCVLPPSCGLGCPPVATFSGVTNSSPPSSFG